MPCGQLSSRSSKWSWWQRRAYFRINELIVLKSPSMRMMRPKSLCLLERTNISKMASRIESRHLSHSTNSTNMLQCRITLARARKEENKLDQDKALHLPRVAYYKSLIAFIRLEEAQVRGIHRLLCALERETYIRCAQMMKVVWKLMMIEVWAMLCLYLTRKIRSIKVFPPILEELIRHKGTET